MFSRLDWKYILFTALIAVCCIVSYCFSNQLLAAIKSFFVFPDLNIWAGAIATIITIIHKIKMRRFTFSASMSFNEFRIPVEDILSFVGNPITIVGSLSLAKGLYLEMTTDNKYFLFTNNPIELTFIGLVAAYLFFLSVMELSKNCREIFTLSQANEEQITAIPQSEVTEETPNVEQ